jgi:hypothetical protein
LRIDTKHSIRHATLAQLENSLSSVNSMPCCEDAAERRRHAIEGTVRDDVATINAPQTLRNIPDIEAHHGRVAGQGFFDHRWGGF